MTRRSHAARITFADYETQLNVAVEVCQLGRAGVELRLSSQLAHMISRAGARGDVQALSEIGRASNWGVRWRVIRALRALGSADAASALLAASAGEWGPVDAAGSKFDIAQEALTALAQLTSPRAVDLITETAASDSKHGAQARRVLGAWSASSRATGADVQRVRPGRDKPDTRR
jgi:HEAT repeat protein